MSKLSIAKALTVVEAEMQRRGLIEMAVTDTLLDHVVGRSVALMATGTELNDLAARLEDMGYNVSTVAPNVEAPAADTIIVSNLRITQPFFDRLESLATYAVVYTGCEMPNGTDHTNLRTEGSDLYVLNKYTIEGESGPHAPLEAVGKVHSRTKTAQGWEYQVALEGATIRSLVEGNKEYPNGTVVRLALEGLTVAGSAYGAVNARIIQPSNAQLTGMTSLLSPAVRRGVLYEATALDPASFAQRYGLSAPLSAVARILQNFSGTEDEALALVQARLPQGTVEPDQSRTLRSFAIGPAEQHRVIGVLLEPDEPYGPQNVWFSAETIERIITEAAAPALDHVDNDEVTILRSFINGSDGVIYEDAKNGSWLVECQVSDRVFAEVLAGTYRGLSIKGLGIVGERNE